MNTFQLNNYSIILKECNRIVFKISAKNKIQAWNKYVEMGFKNYPIKPEKKDYTIKEKNYYEDQ